MKLEIIKAHLYYQRKGATGYVLLHPSGPYHFPGRTGKKDAEAALKRATEAAAIRQSTVFPII